MLAARLQGHLAGCTADNKRQLRVDIASVPKTSCRECRAAPAAIAVAGHSHSRIKRHRSLPTCQAGEQDIGGYTPASYISFSEDPSKQCHHRAEVVVDAPIEACFAMWSDWSKLVDFMDLIGQIGLDNNTPEMALFQCFYRWRKLPIMEIVFLLERTTVEPNSFIAFKSVYGMALLGGVTLQEQDDGRTKVQLYFTHPIPNLLAQMHVGPFGVETHMMQILKDNMTTYKAKVEETAPADWQQAKQQVAARVRQQQEQQRQQQAQQPLPEQQQEVKQPPPQQQQQTQQQAQRPAEQQQQQEAQGLQHPPAPAARKQRTSRRTSAAAEDPAAAGAVAAAASKPRSRAGTSRRTASAAAAADAGSSSSSAAGRRRTRTATGSSAAAGEAGNGTGQQVDAAKPSRRSTTSRRTASTRDQ